MCPLSQAGWSANELLNTACDPSTIQGAQAKTRNIYPSQGLTWVGAILYYEGPSSCLGSPSISLSHGQHTSPLPIGTGWMEESTLDLVQSRYWACDNFSGDLGSIFFSCSGVQFLYA